MKSVDNILVLFFATLISLGALGIFMKYSSLEVAPNTKVSTVTVNTVCVEGVEYIQNYTSHGYSVLTPKINSKTLAYARCE